MKAPITRGRYYVLGFVGPRDYVCGTSLLRLADKRDTIIPLKLSELPAVFRANPHLKELAFTSDPIMVLELVPRPDLLEFYGHGRKKARKAPEENGR